MNEPTALPALPRRLYRAREVAFQFGISPRKAYDLMQQGAIPTVRIDSAVRVRVEDLEQYIADLAADRRAGLLGRAA